MFIMLVVYIILGSGYDTMARVLDQTINKIKIAKNFTINSIKKIYYRNKVNSVIFEIMDIDRFPSISDINRIKKAISFTNLTKEVDINKQQIISIINKNDEQIFDIESDDFFVDAISVTDTYERDDNSVIKIRKKNEPICIHDQF